MMVKKEFLRCLWGQDPWAEKVHCKCEGLLIIQDFLSSGGEGDIRVLRDWVLRFVELWLLLRLLSSCKLSRLLQTDGQACPTWLWSLSINHLFFLFICPWAARSNRGMSHISQLQGEVGLQGISLCFALSLLFASTSLDTIRFDLRNSRMNMNSSQIPTTFKCHSLIVDTHNSVEEFWSSKRLDCRLYNAVWTVHLSPVIHRDWSSDHQDHQSPHLMLAVHVSSVLHTTPST